MPKLKVVTEANGTKVYPITIASGVYDTDNSQRLSDTLKDIKSYPDVYIGIGSNASSVMVNANHHNSVNKKDSITISNANGRLWVILPSSYTPLVTMGGLEVPMTQDGTSTSGGITYKNLKSDNTYSGNFTIRLL